jgi:hypothetical protein
LKALEFKERKPVHIKTKSEVFALGISILEAAHLKSMDDLYNTNKYEINYTLLE